MSGSVPAQGQTLEGLGKTASELISPSTSIDFTGAVKGTLLYVKDWSAFSDDPGQQSGHFFPIHIDDAYAGKEITCKGEVERTASDLDWVLLVKDKTSKFTFTCEGKTILALSFANATFGPAPVSYTSTARRRAVRKKTEV